MADVLDENENPLKWWRENRNTYPLLAMFVRANFSFQCTSVASERIFNKVILNKYTFKLDYSFFLKGGKPPIWS